MATNKDVKIILDKICVSTSALYEIFGVDESTVGRWAKKGCPKAQRGWWSIKDVLDWRSISFKDAKDSKDLNFSEKKTYFEGKLKEAQLEAISLKNQISKGEYIPKEDIVKELQRFFVILKRSMGGYSRKVAAELAHLVDAAEARRMERLINEITNNVLEQISINGVYDGKKTGKDNNS